MRTTRGPITSYEKTEDVTERIKARKPVAKAKRALDPNRPLDGAARFETADRGKDKPRVRNLTVYLNLLPDDDPDDEARTLAAARVLGKRKIRFHDGAYVTNQPDVVAWLRGRIYAGRLRGVVEDAGMMDIKCAHPGCDFTVKNTKAGAQELLIHNHDVHQEEAS